MPSMCPPVVSTHRIRVAVFQGLLLLLAVILLGRVAAAGPPLRVGAHHVGRMLFLDTDGQPSGVFVDILQRIAADQEWQILFVSAPLPILLDALDAGELDVVMAVGFTELRATAYDFSVPVLESATQVLLRPGLTAESLADLAGRRIAAAEADGQAEVIQAQLNAYGVTADVLELTSYGAVVAALRDGTADAGILTQQALSELAPIDDLVLTSIALNPVSVRFAFPKGGDPRVRQAVNQRLEQEKSDEFSTLNRTIMRWMGDSVQGYIWRLLRRLLVLSTILIVLLLMLALAFHLQVRRKTRELRAANEQLRLEVAQRQRAQEELAQSEEYFRTLIENSLEIILIFSEDHRILYVSPSVETVLGYTPEEVVGTAIWDNLHPDDVPLLLEVHETNMRNPGVPSWSEFRARHKNGQWRYLESIGNNLLDHPGVHGIVANCRDITERKTAETALRQQGRLDAFVRDVGMVLTQSETLQASVQQCVDVAAAKLHIAAAVWIMDAPQEKLNLIANSEDVPEELRPQSVPLGLPPIGLAAQQRRPFVTNAAQDQPFVRDPAPMERAGIVAFAVYPLMVETAVVGAAAFYSTVAISDPVLESLSTATRGMAIAIRRRQAEQALRDSEEMVRAIFETAVEGIVVSDVRGRIVSVNHSTEQLFGYAASELIGQNVTILMPPPYSEKHDAYIARYQRAGAAPMMGAGREVRGKRKDGEIIDVWVSVSEIHVGEETLFTGIVHDISQRKKTEAALKESEERFRALVEHAPEAIIVIDYDTGGFDDVNDNAVQMFGVERATLLGMNPSQLSPDIQPDGVPSVIKFVDKMQEAMDGGTPVFDWTHRHVDGHDFDCEVRLLRLPATDRRLVRGSITDITERKRAEKVLENYRATLEEDVARRTEELAEKNQALEETLRQLRETQDQLVINQKMASLGALTAGIAHEIKNPLNFVNNFADLTLELIRETEDLLAAHDSVPADVHELIRSARQNVVKIAEHGGRADSIVRGMLLHSRGKPGERQETAINELLDEYVKLAYHGMRAQDASFNITIETDYDPNIGCLVVVPQDLSRVFLNIVNNACYAAHQRRMNEDGEFRPRLWVTTRDCGDMIEIRIRDNGVGMNDETRQRIFDPFFTTKPTGKGTGLGLSISYDIIVHEHHGELLVASEVGAFTEFRILLPRNHEKRGGRSDREQNEHDGRAYAQGNGG